MENLKQVIEIAAANWELIALLIGFCYHVYKQRKAGKSSIEAITLALNVLKDEAKMVNGKFSGETLAKLAEVKEAIGASKESAKTVDKALQGAEVDIKLGSYRGKPIYLSKALGLATLANKLKKAKG